MNFSSLCCGKVYNLMSFYCCGSCGYYLGVVGGVVVTSSYFLVWLLCVSYDNSVTGKCPASMWLAAETGS